MRNQKGITLIALVITIIVLLILAGVAIAMLSGDNGILSNASNAAKESAISTAKEEIGVKVNEVITQAYADVYVNATATSTNLQSNIKSALDNFDEKEFDDIKYTKPETYTKTTAASGTEGQPGYKPAKTDTLYVIKIEYDGDKTYYEASIDENGTIAWSAENQAVSTRTGFTKQ